MQIKFMEERWNYIENQVMLENEEEKKKETNKIKKMSVLTSSLWNLCSWK